MAVGEGKRDLSRADVFAFLKNTKNLCIQLP
jgi:hypothetical protein